MSGHIPHEKGLQQGEKQRANPDTGTMASADPGPAGRSSSGSRNLLIGLSGPSSSGKTTVARLLRDIFNSAASVAAAATQSISTTPTTSPTPSATTAPLTTNHQQPPLTLSILHEDDFYKTDEDVPWLTTPADAPSGLGSRRLQDWDCVESLDLPLFEAVMGFVKTHGRAPGAEDVDGAEVQAQAQALKGWKSKEDQNSVGPVDVPPALVQQLTSEVAAWIADRRQRRSSTLAVSGGAAAAAEQETNSDSGAEQGLAIVILDGFLLYPAPTSPNPLAQQLRRMVAHTLDLKLFVLGSRQNTIERRGRRSGYVTIEGFWEDPEGYVEDVVWRNYVADHGWMMGQSGSGSEDMCEVDEQRVREEGISLAPGKGEADIGELVQWCVREVMAAVDAGDGAR